MIIVIEVIISGVINIVFSLKIVNTSIIIITTLIVVTTSVVFERTGVVTLYSVIEKSFILIEMHY